MSSLFLKLGSLVIKTLSKPIANRIKAQAREHEAFRRRCVQIAQSIHRWDMRFKLGLLQDHAAIEKQAARDAAEYQARKHKLEAPTVKTEAQIKADEAAAAREKEKGTDKSKPPAPPKPRIRPLSEAKAIDAGANFVSESFLLAIGVGLILFENWRRGEKETSRREDVNEKIRELEGSEKSARRALVELEKEILKLRGENVKDVSPKKRILPKDIWELEEKEEKVNEKQATGWMSWIRGLMRRESGERQINIEDRPEQEPKTVEGGKISDKIADSGAAVKGVSERKRMVWPFNSTTEPNESPRETRTHTQPAPEQGPPVRPTPKTP